MSSETKVRTSEKRLEDVTRRLEEMVGMLGSGERPESLKESVGGSVTDAESTDLAAAMTDLFTADSLVSVLESRRAQALHALDRLRLGLYGVCEDCGDPIGDVRLDYQPEATRCVRCQAAWERASGI